MNFIPPRRHWQASAESSGRISSLLNARGVPNDAVMVIYGSPALPSWLWWLIDSGANGASVPVSGETAVQALYATDDTRATITIGGATGPFLPGDNVLVNDGTSVTLSDGMLMLAFTTGQPSDRATLPTHGEDEFDDYNRRTRCVEGDHIRLDRWKLTGPQSIAVADRPIVFAGLYGSMSLISQGEVVNLASFDTLVATADFTVVPDGLAYLVIATPQ